MSNIILVGMPACGKSTVGVVLAKAMNKDFVDTDILIQKREGMALQDIINKKGNDYFHEAEEATLLDFEGTDTVVATGGSAIYFEKALKKFKENGKIVYLRVSLESIMERLNNIKTRGITLGENQTLEDLYEERIPLYEANADIVIEADGLQVEEIIEKIIEENGVIK